MYVIGSMKEESEEKIIVEFVSLKSKMYSMKNIDDKESNTAKGVNIATEFNEFKDTLFTRKDSGIKWEEFKAKNIKWEHINKISLCVFDDKRFVLNDGIHILAYFHEGLKN